MAKYTFNIATDVGKIRALIGDMNVTDGDDNAEFSDETLSAFLNLPSVVGNLLMAAAIALNAMAAASPALAFETGDLRVDKRSVPKTNSDLAKMYIEMAKSTPSDLIDSYAYSISKFGTDQSDYVNDEY